ncbi:MAG: uridine kinase [Cyclobacteriaceae bacterium]
MKKPLIVGVTGGSGAGKTHIIRGIRKLFSEEELCIISMDHYYKPRDEQPLDSSGVKNFDLPESIDRDQLLQDLRKLMQGEVVLKSEYTYNNPLVSPKQLEFKTAPVLIVEGLFVQYFEEVNELLDLSIFVEAKDHLKLGRRIRRDKIERGYDLEDVLYRYEHHAMPVYEKYIAPLKHSADLIIPNNGNLERVLTVLEPYLRAKG